MNKEGLVIHGYSSMAKEESSAKANSRIKGSASKYFGVTKLKEQKCVYVAFFYDKEQVRSVHLGTFGDEEEAARARDIATFKCSGPKAKYNFPMSEYEEILKLMKNITKQQLMGIIRRCSSRFVRALDSDYRGVARTPGSESWMANYVGEKNAGIFLGSFLTQEEAAMAYDVQAIKVEGRNVLTNFDIKLYNVEAILAASATPGVAEDRAKFFKKGLLDTTQKYANGKGKRFLKRLEDQLRCDQTTGTDEISILIPGQPANSGNNQSTCVVRKGKELLPNHYAAGAGRKVRHSSSSCVKPYHFCPGAGSKFRHSSSSSFKPYKEAKQGESAH